MDLTKSDSCSQKPFVSRYRGLPQAFRINFCYFAYCGHPKNSQGISTSRLRGHSYLGLLDHHCLFPSTTPNSQETCKSGLTVQKLSSNVKNQSRCGGNSDKTRLTTCWWIRFYVFVVNWWGLTRTKHEARAKAGHSQLANAAAFPTSSRAHTPWYGMTLSPWHPLRAWPSGMWVPNSQKQASGLLRMLLCNFWVV